MSAAKEIYAHGFDTVKQLSLPEKARLLAILFFTCTLTCSIKLNSAFLILALLLFVLGFKKELFLQHRRAILIFISATLVSFVAVTWSLNPREGWHVLERQLALFFVPLLLLPGFKASRVKFHLIMKFFFVSIVVVSCYLLNCSVQKFMSSQVPLKDWFVSDNLHHAFSSPIGMHATYLSLYVALAIFTSFYWLMSGDFWWVKILVFLCILPLLVTLIMLSSRVVMFTSVVILFVVYPFYIGKVRHVLTLLLAGAIAVLGFFFMMRESSFFTARVTEKMDAEVKMTPFLKADSTYKPFYGGEMRADRWYCAVELIKEKPWTGYGTGSEKDVLMTKYKKYNLQNAVLNKYDAHNQYLAYALKGGIILLLCFLASIALGIYTALKTRSFIYLSFLLLFVVTCVTENVLESNKGIFFFAFFNALLYSYSLLKREENTVDDTAA